MTTTRGPMPIILPEVIEKIAGIDRGLFDEKEDLHLDLFLMSYYTGGMSLTTLLFLEWYDIDDKEVLDCTRFLYPVCDEMQLDHRHMDILNKYKSIGDDEFIFPMSDDINKWIKGWGYLIGGLAAGINKTIQKAVGILGLDIKVTFRSARYSYLLLCAQKGVPFPEALKFAGAYAIRPYEYHKKITKYLAKLKQKEFCFNSEKINGELVN